MKVIILGDLHFGMRNDSPIFHDLYKQFYANVLFPYIDKHEVTQLVQLGDLFDRRKYINFYTLSQAKEYFFGELSRRALTLHTLIGNHDIYFKNTLNVNSTGLVLGEFDNIKIYDKPTNIEFDDVSFDVVPWICEDNQSEVMEFIKNSESPYCLGHFELQGFEMDRGNICHEGMKADTLKKYDTVFSGHFHHRSINNNIYYVGTPGEMTWADYDDPRGFVVFDTDTREHEFIPNPYTIFRKIKYNDDDLFLNEVSEKDFSEYKGKYVKVIVVKKTNAFLFETYIDSLLKAGPVDVSIVEDFTEVSATEELHEVDQADDTTTILDKYIDSIEIDLNKSKLKSIIKEVYTEALSIE